MQLKKLVCFQPDANCSDTKRPTAPVPRKSSSTTVSAKRTRRRLLRTQLMRHVSIMVAGANLLDKNIPENLQGIVRTKTKIFFESNLPVKKHTKCVVCKEEA